VCAGVINSNNRNADVEEANRSVALVEEDNHISETNAFEAPLSDETRPPAFAPSGLTLKERLAARVASIKEVK
jgi:hypothetical protein